MKPTVPIHDPAFKWIPASSHSTSDAFKARQEERRRAAQTPLPPNVKQIQRKAK